MPRRKKQPAPSPSTPTEVDQVDEDRIISRTATLDVVRGDGDGEPTVVVSVSSETPARDFRRWNEAYQAVDVILAHDDTAIDRQYMDDGLTLRDEHYGDVVGVIRPVTVRGGKLGGPVVWSASERADVIRQDALAKVRRHVSVEGTMNWPADAVQVGQSDDGIPLIRVSRWTPTGAAIISGPPADPTVGVFRAKTQPPAETGTEEDTEDMNEKAPAAPPAETATTIDREAARRAEIRDIVAYGTERNVSPEIVDRAIADGMTFPQFARECVKRTQALPPTTGTPPIELSAKEVRRYSIIDALNAQLYREGGTFEREVSDAISKDLGRKPQGMFVPDQVLIHRAMSSGGTGANLIATELLTGSFIDYLRAKLVLTELGATVITGLRGDVEIPEQTAGATAYWLGRDATVTESDQTFANKKATPHTVAARTLVGRTMLQQSSMDAERLVTADLTAALKNAIDSAAINGLGSAGQPKGLIYADDLNSGTITTPGSATLADIMTFWGQIEADDISGDSSKWLMHPLVAAHFAGRFVNTNTAERFLMLTPPVMAGFPAVISTVLATDRLLFGVWSNVLMAMWGALDVSLDPYSSSATGGVYVTAFQDVDVVIRRAKAFAYNSNVLA